MVKDEKTLGGSACLKAVVIGGKGYGISHSWDGSVLTVSSDSGSSSADLMGPAGARGPAGVETVVAEVRLENGECVSNLSFAEIKEHIDAGDTVVCDYVGMDSRTRCQLTTFAEYGAVFVMQSVLGADEYFAFTADGVTHVATESGEETIALDFTNFSNGSFKETLANGTEITHTVEFDDEHNIVSIGGITVRGLSYG